LPENQVHFTELNEELSKVWPVLAEKKEGPVDGADWDGKPDKIELLER